MYRGLRYKCPICKRENLRKDKAEEYGIRTIILKCHDCRYQFRNMEYFYELFLKEKNLEKIFWDWVNPKKDFSDLIYNKHVDIVLHAQRTNISTLTGRMLYISIKTPFEEMLFCQKSEYKVISSFLDFLKKTKSYKIIVFDKSIIENLTLRSNHYKISMPTFRVKSIKFKGIVTIKDLLEETNRTISKKLDFLIRNFDLINVDASKVSEQEKIFELLYQKIGFLHLNHQAGLDNKQIKVLLSDPRYKNFLVFALKEVRGLFTLYQTLNSSDSI